MKAEVLITFDELIIKFIKGLDQKQLYINVSLLNLWLIFMKHSISMDLKA